MDKFKRWPLLSRGMFEPPWIVNVDNGGGQEVATKGNLNQCTEHLK